MYVCEPTTMPDAETQTTWPPASRFELEHLIHSRDGILEVLPLLERTADGGGCKRQIQLPMAGGANVRSTDEGRVPWVGGSPARASRGDYVQSSEASGQS